MCFQKSAMYFKDVSSFLFTLIFIFVVVFMFVFVFVFVSSLKKPKRYCPLMKKNRQIKNPFLPKKLNAERNFFER